MLFFVLALFYIAETLTVKTVSDINAHFCYKDNNERMIKTYLKNLLAYKTRRSTICCDLNFYKKNINMVGVISIQNSFILLMVLLPKPLKIIILWSFVFIY